MRCKLCNGLAGMACPSRVKLCRNGWASSNGIERFFDRLLGTLEEARALERRDGEWRLLASLQLGDLKRRSEELLREYPRVQIPSWSCLAAAANNCLTC